jgi:hypothetical protein
VNRCDFVLPVARASQDDRLPPISIAHHPLVLRFMTLNLVAESEHWELT